VPSTSIGTSVDIIDIKHEKFFTQLDLTSFKEERIIPVLKNMFDPVDI
jgi:hypothetical protein